MKDEVQKVCGDLFRDPNGQCYYTKHVKSGIKQQVKNL